MDQSVKDCAHQDSRRERRLREPPSVEFSPWALFPDKTTVGVRAPIQFWHGVMIESFLYPLASAGRASQAKCRMVCWSLSKRPTPDLFIGIQ